jgi:hypothetical protein
MIPTNQQPRLPISLACPYPVVIVVLPSLGIAVHSRAAYLLFAETFAPLVECALFWFAFVRPGGAGGGVA